MRLKLRSPDFPLLRRLVSGGEGPRTGDLLSCFFFDREFIDQAIEHGQEDAGRTLLADPSTVPWQILAPDRRQPPRR